MLGSKTLLVDVKNYIIKSLNIKPHIYDRKHIHVLNLTRRNDILKLILWLFDRKIDIYMLRKINKCQQFIKEFLKLDIILKSYSTANI